jgi:hypothetical protein
MEYKLVVKNCNGLYTIYLTKFYKVLIRVISGVIIVLNFYIYKKLFGFTQSIIYKSFNTLKLAQEALVIYNCRVLSILIKFTICLFLLIKSILY